MTDEKKFTFAETMALAREMAAIRVWQVPVHLGERETHINVYGKSAEDALATARRMAHVQPWTIAHDAVAEEHPNFKAPEPPALDALDEVAQRHEVLAEHAEHLATPPEPHDDDDRAVLLEHEEHEPTPNTKR